VTTESGMLVLLVLFDVSVSAWAFVLGRVLEVKYKASGPVEDVVVLVVVVRVTQRAPASGTRPEAGDGLGRWVRCSSVPWINLFRWATQRKRS
jgi:hypothetical protein